MNHKFIYPYESTEVEFWTKKWGIAPDELNEAILQTGSVRAREVREYLERKGKLFSLSGQAEKFRRKWQVLISQFKEEDHYL